MAKANVKTLTRFIDVPDLKVGMQVVKRQSRTKMVTERVKSLRWSRRGTHLFVNEAMRFDRAGKALVVR